MEKIKTSPRITKLLSDIKTARLKSTSLLEMFNQANDPGVKTVSVFFTVLMDDDTSEIISEKYAAMHKEIFLEFLQKSSELYSRIALEKETEIASLINQ